jgi:hypothetical protein
MEKKVRQANDLKWIIENGEGEIDYYLSTVSQDQFIYDVKTLIKRQTDKDVIKRAIQSLKEYL